jgi:hypothetical protein
MLPPHQLALAARATENSVLAPRNGSELTSPMSGLSPHRSALLIDDPYARREIAVGPLDLDPRAGVGEAGRRAARRDRLLDRDDEEPLEVTFRVIRGPQYERGMPSTCSAR